MKPTAPRSLRLVDFALSKVALLAAQSMRLPYRPDELYRVPTDDGASIALGRYHARGERRYAEPVVLAHGLGANRFDLDFDERYSLARYLARRGFDTWVLELRGRGLSGPPIDCTFDEQAEHDLTTALRSVLSTGAKAVTWVGHSKGGLVLYAHLAKNPQAPVRAGVCLGTPITFEHNPGLKRFMKAIGPLLSLPVVPVAHLAMLTPLGIPPGPIGPHLVYEANMEPEVVRKAIANLPSNIPGGVARQFQRWISRGSFDSLDGSIDYRASLQGARIPFLLIAGTKDLLASDKAVFEAAKYLGGPVHTMVAGKAGGLSEDYGHGDLSLGRRAPEEIFPKVEEFLAAHSTAA